MSQRNESRSCGRRSVNAIVGRVAIASGRGRPARRRTRSTAVPRDLGVKPGYEAQPSSTSQRRPEECCHEVIRLRPSALLTWAQPVCQASSMTEALEVSERLRIATYWWLASELVRRHPELNVVETYPMDGFYDCLSVIGGSANGSVHIDMNRLGSVHVHPKHVGLMSVDELVSYEDPLKGVRRLEEAAGLPKGSSFSSGARIITLRLIAQTLALVVNDSSRWDVRMITPRGDGYSISLFEPETPNPAKWPFSAVFPSEALHHSFVVSSNLSEEVNGRLWGLQKDGLVVAIFDTRGLVYTREQRTSVKPPYARLGRSLTLTAVHALGNLLP